MSNEQTTSIIWHILSFLSLALMSGHESSRTLSVYALISHSIFFISASSALFCLVTAYDLSATSNPSCIQILQCNMVAILLGLQFSYSFWAYILHADTMCVALSYRSPHDLHTALCVIFINIRAEFLELPAGVLQFLYLDCPSSTIQLTSCIYLLMCVERIYHENVLSILLFWV